MICPNCKKEYNNSLFSCPYCGAVNRNTYKDIEMKELKEKVIDSFFQDLKTSPKSLIKELPLLVLAIIIFAIAYFLNIYYFTKLETESFLFQIMTNYSLWILIFTPLVIYPYYRKISLTSLILNIYFAIFIFISLGFPFFLELMSSNNTGFYLLLLLVPLLLAFCLFIIKKTGTYIKAKLLNHHVITYLLFMLATLYLLITLIIIIIRQLFWQIYLKW